MLISTHLGARYSDAKFPARKILVLAANPEDTSRLRLDKEVREIQQSLQLSKERDYFELVSEWAVRTEDLLQTLVTHQPHIVHFLGHGTEDHGLILEDSRGRSQLVLTRALARLFQQMVSVECVLLNACYSDTQAKAISQFVSCVIGMNQPIGDPAAMHFSFTYRRRVELSDESYRLNLKQFQRITEATKTIEQSVVIGVRILSFAFKLSI